jgi:hypothetical protein
MYLIKYSDFSLSVINSEKYTVCAFVMTIFATSTGRNFYRVFHYQCQLVEVITVIMHIFFSRSMDFGCVLISIFSAESW